MPEVEEEAEARPEQSADEGEESDDTSTSGASGAQGDAKKRRKKVGQCTCWLLAVHLAPLLPETAGFESRACRVQKKKKRSGTAASGEDAPSTAATDVPNKKELERRCGAAQTL